jgi:hypothetical protein
MSDDQTGEAGGRTNGAARRRPARFGTVLWGVLLLVFALAMAVSALPMFGIDTTTLVLGACVAAGLLLVTAGVATSITRGGR